MKKRRSKKGFGHVYLRGGIWWIKYHSAGRPEYESSKSRSKADAEELLKKRISEVHGKVRRTKIVFMDELLDDLLDYYEVQCPKSNKFAKATVNGKASGLRSYFGRLRPAQVTTDRIVDFKRKLKGAGQENATINRKLALLHRAFTLAMAATPPKAGLAPFCHRLPENAARQGFLEWTDYYRLMEALETNLRLLLMVGYHTGARLGELLRAEIRQVDLVGRKIVLRSGETKNDEGRVLPIYGDMVEVLEKHVADTKTRFPECKHLFHRSGKNIVDFRTGWWAATEAVGLGDLLFHDLRRSAARNMRKAKIHIHTIMKICGWKTDGMFRRYDIIDDADVQEASALMAEQSKVARAERKPASAVVEIGSAGKAAG